MNNFKFQKENTKNLLLKAIDYNRGDISLGELWGDFLHILTILNIPLKTIQNLQEEKNKTRGDFEKKLIMEYILIPTNSPLAFKYFLSSNNIFSGIKKIENQFYYKFLTQKAIRSHIPHLTLAFSEFFKIEDPLLPIGKVFIATHEEFLQALKFKLIEETKEVLYSKNLEELQEELGDVYLIIIYLQNLEK